MPAALDLPTTQELQPATTALVLPGDWAVEGLPAIVQRAGPAAAERVVEFFTAQIRNAHTRAAYGKAVTRFLTWCDKRGLELYQISPVAVALYVEELQGVYRAPTTKQHLAAIRRLFDWLVVGRVVSWNPAATVRGPTHIVKRGKTPVLQPDEVRLLLDSIDTSAVGGLRDRALLGVMTYSFARVTAVVNMNIDDYYQQGKRWWLRLREKGGKEHALPVHHKGEEYLDAYLETAGIGAERGIPLWRSLRVVAALAQRLRHRRERCRRALGERLPGLSRPQPNRIRERPLEPVAGRGVGEVVELGLVRLADAVRPVGADPEPHHVGTIKSGGFSSASEYCRSCSKAAPRSARRPLLLPGEVVPLPDVRPAVAARVLARAAFEAVRLAGRVGLDRRRFAQQPAQVDEVLLRGRALLQLGGPPLADELVRRHAAVLSPGG